MKKYLFLIALVIVAGLGVYALTLKVQPANAAPSFPVDIKGWLWSSNVGFFSLNCIDTAGLCATTPYKVQIQYTGSLTGYGFSSNIGVLKFNAGDGPSHMGGGQDGTYPIPAKIDLTTGKITGWIRACGGMLGSPTDACSGGSRSDGWDGWISMSGDAQSITMGVRDTYGVTVNSNGDFSGKAWGGPVVGWLDFATDGAPSNRQGPSCVGGCSPLIGSMPVSITGSCTKTSQSAIDSDTDRVTFTASPISTPNTPTLPYKYKWDGGALTTSNTYTRDYDAPTVAGNAPTLIVYDSALPTPNGGALPCPDVSVSPAANVPLYIGSTINTANSSSLQVRRGNPFVLRWVNDIGAHSCTATPPAWTSWTGTFTSSGSSPLTTDGNTPTGDHIFTLRCKDSLNNNLPLQTVTLKVISSIEIEI